MVVDLCACARICTHSYTQSWDEREKTASGILCLSVVCFARGKNVADLFVLRYQPNGQHILPLWESLPVPSSDKHNCLVRHSIMLVKVLDSFILFYFC